MDAFTQFLVQLNFSTDCVVISFAIHVLHGEIHGVPRCRRNSKPDFLNGNSDVIFDVTRIPIP